MPKNIKWSNESIMLVPIQANQQKPCKLAARIIAKLSEEN